MIQDIQQIAAQVVQSKPTWEILAQPIATVFAGATAVGGATWLANVGFARSLKIESDKSSRQIAEKRVFLLAESYAELFVMMRDYIVLYDKFEDSQTEVDIYSLEEEIQDLWFKILSKAYKIHLFDSNPDRRRLLANVHMDPYNKSAIYQKWSGKTMRDDFFDIYAEVARTLDADMTEVGKVKF